LKARAPRWEARAATVSNSDSHRDTPTPQRRQAFSFSRDLQFATEPELAKRMGCPRPIWLRAALKELIDNSLDTAEEAGIEPAIRVALDENILSVSDNGPGMSPELGRTPMHSVRAHIHARGLRGARSRRPGERRPGDRGPAPRARP
jgi:signal transduction histidine kinase